MRRRRPLHEKYLDDPLLLLRHLRRFNKLPRQDLRLFKNLLMWEREIPPKLEYLLQAMFVMASPPETMFAAG